MVIQELITPSHVLNSHFPSMGMFYFWLRGERKRFDRLLVSSRTDDKRTDFKVHGCHEVWRFSDTRWAAQRSRTKTPWKDGKDRCGLCVIFHALFVQFPKRGRFLRMFSVGHQELFFDSRSPASSLSPITQQANLDKLCLDPVQRQ